MGKAQDVRIPDARSGLEKIGPQPLDPVGAQPGGLQGGPLLEPGLDSLLQLVP
jgi:hypothetical protein